MTVTRPTLLTMFIAAYWDVGRFLRAHWRLAALTAAIVFAAFLARAHLPRAFGVHFMNQIMLRHAVDIVAIVLVAPFLLAVHRFILLGEVQDRYAFEPRRPRFQSFAGWLVVVLLAASIPSLLFLAARSSGPIYYVGQVPGEGLKPLLLLLTTGLIVLVGFLRMILLFPAIAVDAPEASWQNAFGETQAAPWFAGFACILPLVPIFLIGAVLVPMTRAIPFARHTVWAALVLLTVTILAAVASRLHQVLARPAARAPMHSDSVP
jgi:hypothetical protein